MESSCTCNSELKDTDSDHSELIKSHSPEVGAIIMYIFQMRGFEQLAQGHTAGVGLHPHLGSTLFVAAPHPHGLGPSRHTAHR